MVLLTVGKNSYGLVSECDTYLDGSIRAAETWLGVAPDDKKRTMISAYRKIETRIWNGTSAAIRIVDTAVLAAAGTGYAKNDLLTVVGGTAGEAAVMRVLTVGGSGEVATFEIAHAGTYDTDDEPTSPVATTVLPAGGLSCTLTLTFTDQVSDHPRSGLVDCDGRALDSTTYATRLKEAQFEMAFVLNEDPDEEASSGEGTNVKAVGAGSAKVEFFRPKGDNERFPPQVQELLACLVAGNGNAAIGGSRGGAENASVFDDWPGSHALNRGY